MASLDCVTGNLRIRDAATGKQIHNVQAGTGRPYSTLYWSPDGATLAICVEANLLKLLDLASGEFLPQPLAQDVWLAQDGYFAWSPDGRRFVSNAATGFRIWDVATLEPLVTLESYKAI